MWWQIPREGRRPVVATVLMLVVVVSRDLVVQVLAREVVRVHAGCLAVVVVVAAAAVRQDLAQTGGAAGRVARGFEERGEVAVAVVVGGVVALVGEGR